MPPRRRATAPVPIDIEAVRRKLADGKIVRVGISRSAQFPDGGTGRVRSIGDPQTAGEEYVQVELSLNGMKDVLPFTPADLTPATRGRPPGSGRQIPPSDSSSPARVVPSTMGGAATQRGSTRRESTPSAFSAQSSAGQGSPQPTRAESATSESGQQSSTSEASTPPAASASKTKSPRGAGRPAAVAVTVATSPSESTQWRIEARVGNKVAVKSAAVSPARVWELVQALQNEELSDAVGAILEQHRADAQARADTLASELAAVRAELQALPARRQ